MTRASLVTFFLLATASFAQASRIAPACLPSSSTQLQDEKLLLLPIEATVKVCLAAIDNIVKCASHLSFSLGTFKFNGECCDAIDAAVDKCIGGVIPNFHLPPVFKNFCHVVVGAPTQSPPVSS